MVLSHVPDIFAWKQVSSVLTRERLQRNMEYVLEAAGAMKLVVQEPQDRPWLDFDQLDQMHRLRNEVISCSIWAATFPYITKGINSFQTLEERDTRRHILNLLCALYADLRLGNAWSWCPWNPRPIMWLSFSS